MTNRTRAIVLLSVALGVGSCGEKVRSALPSSPSAPSAIPSPAPSGSQPHISEIVPATSTTAGGAWGTIRGSGFEGNASVTFGGVLAAYVFTKDSNTLGFGTVAHDAGTVDVVVRNRDGRADTLVRGYTFAPQASFDFNGVWDVHSGDEYEMEMQFVVENNVLISLTCGSSPTVTFSTPADVSGGEFSYVEEDGLKMAGRLLSPTTAKGTINLAPCAPVWWADKR